MTSVLADPQGDPRLDRVRALDVPVAAVRKAIRGLGIGSAPLLAGRLGEKPPR